MNVLFLTHRLPYAPNRGDRIRAYYLLRELARFSTVTLISLVHDEDEAQKATDVPYATRVEVARTSRLGGLAKGALRLPTSRPLTHSLLDSPKLKPLIRHVIHDTRPDVVVAFCSGMARFALEPPLAGIPMVLDMVDVDSVKWAELSARTAWPKGAIYRREARTLRAFERQAAEAAGAVLVVNARERDLMQEIAPTASTHVLENGVDIDAFAPPGPPSAEPVVAFTGVMDYGPNADAAIAFAQGPWPLIRRQHPDARFVIVGANPTEDVRALARDGSGIEVTGAVPKVQPYLWQSAVSVAPIAVARGLQNKVLEALAAGLPAVVSSAVASGLPAGVERGCVVADEPQAVAEAVLALLEVPADVRRARAASAAVERLSWQRQFESLARILTSAVAQSSSDVGYAASS